ncbi:hypothetical protein AB0I54_46910 [Streptomyces sp. NPDC050625]|uniref:hypothetical protein n=1 Tax=Streptomyces sp. NPDC050625 TaxID=3154629 RepID=UPI003414F47C
MSAIIASCVGAPRRLSAPEAAVIIVVIVLAAGLGTRGALAGEGLSEVIGLLGGAGLAGALVIRTAVSRTLDQMLQVAGSALYGRVQA